MATVIDELIVVLNLDPAKFNEGQRQALEAFKKTQEAAVAGAKGIEAQGAKTLEFFINLKREALGLLAVFLGGRGFGEMVHHITSLDASTERLSTRVKVNAHDLAVWQVVMREVGGTVEDARSAMEGIQSEYQKFLLDPGGGSSMISAGLPRIGVRPEDYDKPDKILDKLAEFSQSPQMKGRPEAFAAFARMFFPGMTDAMIAALGKGPTELNKLKSDAEKVTTTNQETGFASERFIKSMALLETASEAFGRVILQQFVPAMDTLSGFLADFFHKPDAEIEAAGKENFWPANIMGRDLYELLVGPKGAEAVFGPKPQDRIAPNKRPGHIPSRDPDWGRGPDWGKGGGIETLVLPDLPGGAKTAAEVTAIIDRSHRSSNRTSTSETNIGTINVNAPNATDARGIAGAIRGHLSDVGLGSNSINSGAQ